MSAEHNKALVRRFVEEYQTGADERAFDELMHPDFVDRSLPPGVAEGPDGVRQQFDGFRATFAGFYEPYAVGELSDRRPDRRALERRRHLRRARADGRAAGRRARVSVVQVAGRRRAHARPPRRQAAIV